MKRIIVVLLALLIMTSLAACKAAPDDSGDVGIRGLITTVTIAEDQSDAFGSILVEGSTDDNTCLVSDKASVTLTADTVFVHDSEKKYMEATDMENLTVGTKVEIIFTGPVAESYPVQGSAKVVRIIE